ncbi:LruC domain-containing protein [Psychrobium sp. nBUS_13]|jgi:LruC domain-containing protein|uniref:LruC domain-containing protein n=1 Tax=Psychrobium sp. nBUS_13 TaxID=3395319 RepID=UPI003EB82229
MSNLIKNRAFQGLVLISAVVGAANTQATPFTDCPTEAFLVQDKIANLYGVQLATGFYEKISPTDWGQEKMNALAFNVHDRYLYAFNYYYGTIVKLDSNYQLTVIPVEDMPNKGFYVGDIAVAENVYYLYRPGNDYGLFRIPLDESAPDYLQMTKVVNGSVLNHAIYDLAFHPSNGFAYSVDRWGNLLKIDVQSGTSETLSNVGQSGTFGAVYFDVTGNLYISRNSDGYIFRINTNWNYPVAEFFAYGPSSSNNDGARCALAPIVSLESPTTDFGDAPDSYGSSINNNGARHDVGDGTLFLGNAVTTEPNAYADDGSDINDNDGIQFATGIEAGKTAIVEITASADGFVNAWLDGDKSGEFDNDEKIVSEKSVSAGSNIVAYDVPTWSESGTTWSRFRLSSQAELTPVGGVADGEVEDYKVDIAQQNVTANYYPSIDSWATLAFEDNWPLVGDYDMNDLVVHYRLSAFDVEGTLMRIKIEGEIVAIGASYHNGFAFRIPGLLRNQIDTNRMSFKINGVEQTTSALESNRIEAIFIIADDLWDFVTAGEDCKYYRTEAGCGSNIQMTFAIEIPMTANVDKTNIANFPYDPFIFASQGHERNYLFGEAPERRFEIHLKNQAPTEAFQANFLNRGDDASNATNGEYFINANGMPWAINIPYQWQHPLEYMDIKFAYPDFHGYVTSSGSEKTDWFTVEKSTIKNVFNQ